MKKVIATLALVLTSTFAFAQDTPLEISGSADAYWKYDFAKTANIPTSFATDHNSVSLGMIDVVLKKKTGKTSFVGEVSFGPRGTGQSIPDVDGQSFHIQNLYATYAASDKLSLTAGYMGTFVGYEVISPLANFHYSTSYLFTTGPFQNAGIKANYAVSSKVGLMVGLFNDQWNTYKATPEFGLNAFGAQFTLTPAEGLTAYFNLLTGSESGTIFDLTAAYQMSPKFKLGLNAADFSGVESGSGYSGIALYPSVAISDSFGLGLRAESFKSKTLDTSVSAFTLSANLKSGGLTFIPEIRLDSASEDSFYKSNGNPTKSASQFAVAMVYGF
ncbi:MAG TPA: porin [Flavobacterium sp.]|nr:porin [Flavobacterium sp.]